MYGIDDEAHSTLPHLQMFVATMPHNPHHNINGVIKGVPGAVRMGTSGMCQDRSDDNNDAGTTVRQKPVHPTLQERSRKTAAHARYPQGTASLGTLKGDIGLGFSLNAVQSEHGVRMLQTTSS